MGQNRLSKLRLGKNTERLNRVITPGHTALKCRFRKHKEELLSGFLISFLIAALKKVQREDLFEIFDVRYKYVIEATR